MNDQNTISSLLALKSEIGEAASVAMDIRVVDSEGRCYNAEAVVESAEQYEVLCNTGSFFKDLPEGTLPDDVQLLNANNIHCEVEAAEELGTFSCHATVYLLLGVTYGKDPRTGKAWPQAAELANRYVRAREAANV